MDYYDDAILEKLPERRRPPPAVHIDRVSTHVEEYVRDEVEAVPPIAADSPLLQEVMAALHKLNVAGCKKTCWRRSPVPSSRAKANIPLAFDIFLPQKEVCTVFVYF